MEAVGVYLPERNLELDRVIVSMLYGSIAMELNRFSFVVSSGPNVSRDPALRTMIRKQAMRDVAIERRRRGKISVSNSAQDGTSDKGSASSSSRPTLSSDHPGTHTSCRTVPGLEEILSLLSDSGSTSTSNSSHSTSPPSHATYSHGELMRWKSSVVNTDWSLDGLPTICSSIIPNPLSAFDAVCAKYNVDLQDLSALTGFSVTLPVVMKLADSELLNTLLGHRQFSYLQFIPSRYDSSECISATVDCLLAKLASRVNATDSRRNAETIALYAKALRTVQDSIGSGKQCRDANLLCAIQLLSLYELLDAKRQTAWQQYIAGSAQVIKHRKAAEFRTDYEKALFHSHVGPAILESLLDMDHCYLEAPEWQQVYLSFIKDTTWLTNRSSLTVRLRLSETHLPGMLADVKMLVSSRLIFDHVASHALRDRVQRMHKLVLGCMDEYQAHLMQTSLLQPPQSELDLRRELLGHAIEHLCLLKRMLAILVDDSRQRLEIEVQALALLLKGILDQPSPRHAWLLTEHEMGIVWCVQSTKLQWEEDVSEKSNSEQQEALIKRWTAFNAALNRW